MTRDLRNWNIGILQTVGVVCGAIWKCTHTVLPHQTKVAFGFVKRHFLTRKSLFSTLSRIFWIYILVSLLFAGAYYQLYRFVPVAFQAGSKIHSLDFYARTTLPYLFTAMLEALRETHLTHGSISGHLVGATFRNLTITKMSSSPGYYGYLYREKECIDLIERIEKKTYASTPSPDATFELLQAELKELMKEHEIHLCYVSLYPDLEDGGSSRREEWGESVFATWSLSNARSIDRVLDRLGELITKEENAVVQNLTFVDFWYFSIVTMSTLGYGDILPNYSFVRVIVVLQVLIGFFIVVVVISTVVAHKSSQQGKGTAE